MDLSDIFRKGLQDLHKNALDKNYKKRSLLSRKESLMNARRQTRDTLMFSKRQIPADISPYVTPKPNSKERTGHAEIAKAKNEESNKRYEMLKQWKEKRNKQKEAAKKLAKPIFKVCHVDRNIGLPNLENVNKQIKGKQIKTIGTPPAKSFAPANHTFQPPANIKPVQIAKTVSRNIPQSQNTSVKPQVLKKSLKPKLNVEENTQHVKSMSDVRREKSLVKPKSSSSFVHKVSANKINKTASTVNSNNKLVKMNEFKKNVIETHSSVQKSDNGSYHKVTYQTKCKNGYLESKPKMNTDKKSKSSLKVNNNTTKNKETSITDFITPTKLKPSKAKQFTNNSTTKPNKNKDNVSNNDDDFEIEKVVIYDDEEVTFKTPVKKSRDSQPSSARKSVKKSGCVKDIDQSNEKLDKMMTPLKDEKLTNNDNIIKNKTPKKSLTSTEHTPVYISPFVTISRGKDSARKEFNKRKSTGGTLMFSPEGIDFSQSTSPQAGADYFEKVLDNQISRIESICKIWNNYKQTNNLPEEANDMIDVAIGQSKLLISKKFEQFRGLIGECRLSDFKNKPITCEDLHGFWDMIYQQVIDLDKRFANLEQMKSNNWEEVVPEKKIVQTRKRGRPKKPTASSSIKDMIKAARNKIKNKEDFEVQLLEPKTPEPSKKLSPIRTSSARRSLRKSLLRGQSIKRLSSPGLTMMKITQSIKAGDGLTPSKSILKTDLTKSAKRHTKSVLFVDDIENESKNLEIGNDNKENYSMEANLSIMEVQNKNLTPVRRSERLNKLT